MGGVVPLGDASRRPARSPPGYCPHHLRECLGFCVGADAWRNIRDAMVSGASANCFRPSLDHDSDRDVHARQLVAHHRQHDFLMGLCPRNRRCYRPGPLSCLLTGGRVRGHACPGFSRPTLYGTQPRREWSNRSRNGRVSGHLSSRSYSHATVYICLHAD
jgi:hypothetical protein